MSAIGGQTGKHVLGLSFTGFDHYGQSQRLNIRSFSGTSSYTKKLLHCAWGQFQDLAISLLASPAG